MERECTIIEEKSVTTDGKPSEKLICYCETTVCTKIQPNIQNNSLPYDFICECGNHKRKNGQWIN